MGKRVMILSASNGSGHIMAAAAIEEACRADGRISELVNLDALDFTNKVLQEIYSKGYLEAVKVAPALWSLAFDRTDRPWYNSSAITSFHRLNSLPLVKKVKEFKPDICICTHGMPAQIISTLIANDEILTNLGIVVTDFYVHAFWLSDVVTRYFVAKEESKVYLNSLGLPSDRIVVSGIPIMKSFTRERNPGELCLKHGLADDRPVVLLSAGMVGSMSGKDIIRILDQIQTEAQIVVVCGKNEKLKASLDELTLPFKGNKGKTYVIVGFTNEMHELLALADIFIGKPGGLSTSECMACGVPMIIWDPIPGQELYNTFHVLENGAGVMPDSAQTVGFNVDRILRNKALLEKMSKNARSTAFPHAAKTVVDAMLQNEDETPVKAFKKTAS